MKARIRNTDIEVDVQPFYDETGYFAGFWDGYNYYHSADLVFPDTPDWDDDIDWSSFRREAAKDILASISKTFISIEDAYLRKGVALSVKLTDELIKQLKEEQK